MTFETTREAYEKLKRESLEMLQTKETDMMNERDFFRMTREEQWAEYQVQAQRATHAEEQLRVQMDASKPAYSYTPPEPEVLADIDYDF